MSHDPPMTSEPTVQVARTLHDLDNGWNPLCKTNLLPSGLERLVDEASEDRLAIESLIKAYRESGEFSTVEELVRKFDGLAKSLEEATEKSEQREREAEQLRNQAQLQYDLQTALYKQKMDLFQQRSKAVKDVSEKELAGCKDLLEDMRRRASAKLPGADQETKAGSPPASTQSAASVKGTSAHVLSGSMSGKSPRGDPGATTSLFDGSTKKKPSPVSNSPPEENQPGMRLAGSPPASTQSVSVKGTIAHVLSGSMMSGTKSPRAPSTTPGFFDEGTKKPSPFSRRPPKENQPGRMTSAGSPPAGTQGVASVKGTSAHVLSGSMSGITKSSPRAPTITASFDGDTKKKPSLFFSSPPKENQPRMTPAGTSPPASTQSVASVKGTRSGARVSPRAPDTSSFLDGGTKKKPSPFSNSPPKENQPGMTSAGSPPASTTQSVAGFNRRKANVLSGSTMSGFEGVTKPSSSAFVPSGTNPIHSLVSAKIRKPRGRRIVRARRPSAKAHFVLDKEFTNATGASPAARLTQDNSNKENNQLELVVADAAGQLAISGSSPCGGAITRLAAAFSARSMMDSSTADENDLQKPPRLKGAKKN